MEAMVNSSKEDKLEGKENFSQKFLTSSYHVSTALTMIIFSEKG